jgi:electron transfer flavoprotein alpha subunit
VWVETDGRSCRKVSREILAEAARMAGPGGRVSAAAFGEGAKAAAEAAKGTADSWFVGAEGALAAYDAPSWAAALRATVDACRPDLVLGGASARAREVFAFLSASAGWPFASECARVRVEAGTVEAARPILGGRALQVVRSAVRPFLATVRPNTFALEPPPAPRAGGISALSAPAPGPAAGQVKYGAVERKSGARPDLVEADAVVAGGRGLKDPKNFRLIEELADALGGAVGASRAVVDAGWRDVSEQVGKSGRTVSPRLYVAAGISGAIHHLMGMDTARVVAAIDKDPSSPMFAAADYGIVGDALEVLPALAKAVREAAKA